MCQCVKKMSKRTYEMEMEEEEILLKRPKTGKKIDFTIIEKGIQRQMKEAVSAALNKDSIQPILLEIKNLDTEDETLAYWPASQEVGEWLLQALLASKESGNLYEHPFLAEVLGSLCESDYGETYKGYFDDRIKCEADLGKFNIVLFSSLERKTYEDGGRPSVKRTDLSPWLYIQYCYTWV